jgi:serine/tyrosine/threonine adenylyltransferase
MSGSNTLDDLSGASASKVEFDNRFTRELPADEIEANTRRQVHRAGYSRVRPAVVAGPELVAHSAEVAELLGFSDEFVEAPEFVAAFSGNETLSGMDPHAMCYGGHQFGNWAGQLGDGRAIALGEVVDVNGDHQMLQLKGAGPTPYSRGADGLAVLRSSVREFLCSEAMHHLGVPTTRALSLVTTGEQVMRDMFYDGNAAPEPGAIVCRVAPSFLRFGSFELPAARGDVGLLKNIADFTITTLFPHLLPVEGSLEVNTIDASVYAAWFREVCNRTAILMNEWLRVGFVHGVMNTDNLSILGLTIDYGPYGWLEPYDPSWTPNTTDAGGRRYRFGNQPQIGQWNLVQLANAIYPLIEDAEPLQAAIDGYVEVFQENWRRTMGAKLGWSEFGSDDAEGKEIADELLAILQLVETDMTIFYRALGELSSAAATTDELLAPFRAAYYSDGDPTSEVKERSLAWARRHVARLAADGRDDAERRAAMNAVNPKYVLRNYLAQLAIDRAEQGDNGGVTELLEVLRHPYDEQPGNETFAEKRPEWARSRPGCSMLSCSS